MQITEAIFYPLLSVVFSCGLTYSFFNEKIKAIEKALDEKKDFGDRLTRIEEKTNLILDHFLKN